MKVNEIETIGDVEFPQHEATARLNLANKIDKFNHELDIYFVSQDDIRILLLANQQVAALASFVSRNNDKIWQAKNVATYFPYAGAKLSGHLYKYAKEKLKKSIQSDTMQTHGGKVIWSKILPSIGLNPMMFDIQTERIGKPDLNLLYPEEDSPDLHRYIWILERNDFYPMQNRLDEQLLMPYTGLWYNQKRET